MLRCASPIIHFLNFVIKVTSEIKKPRKFQKIRYTNSCISLAFIIILSIQPIVIVPEGKEPTQLLYLFRGKFIIQKYPQLQVNHAS